MRTSSEIGFLLDCPEALEKQRRPRRNMDVRFAGCVVKLRIVQNLSLVIVVRLVGTKN